MKAAAECLTPVTLELGDKRVDSNSRVGKILMKAAMKYLTPVTFELGSKR